MSKRLSISVSVVLLAAFLVFNVGMPVYFYLCPMMSDESPMCDVSPAQADGQMAFAAKTPDCCARIFVADRKTTPFVKAADLQIQHDQVLAVIPAAKPSLGRSFVTRSEVLSLVSESPPPLYILHSTLLI